MKISLRAARVNVDLTQQEVADKLGVSKDKYLNIVSEYGNMVSVAVPFGLAYALDHGYVKEGDTIFLMGTAAGMTVNMLALKL